jgi:hypothetical protein
MSLKATTASTAERRGGPVRIWPPAELVALFAWASSGVDRKKSSIGISTYGHCAAMGLRTQSQFVTLWPGQWTPPRRPASGAPAGHGARPRVNEHFCSFRGSCFPSLRCRCPLRFCRVWTLRAQISARSPQIGPGSPPRCALQGPPWASAGHGPLAPSGGLPGALAGAFPAPNRGASAFP